MRERSQMIRSSAHDPFFTFLCLFRSAVPCTVALRVLYTAVHCCVHKSIGDQRYPSAVYRIPYYRIPYDMIPKKTLSTIGDCQNPKYLRTWIFEYFKQGICPKLPGINTHRAQSLSAVRHLCPCSDSLPAPDWVVVALCRALVQYVVLSSTVCQPLVG